MQLPKVTVALNTPYDDGTSLPIGRMDAIGNEIETNQKAIVEPNSPNDWTGSPEVPGLFSQRTQI